MKDILKLINYSLNQWLLKLYNIIYKEKKNKMEDRILVIKTDNIGDFILWSNSLYRIVKKYQKKEITLICDKNSYQILELLKNLEIKIIKIERKKFLRSFIYRWNILKKISKKYELVINPLYSRDFISESLILFSQAKKKIGIAGDTTNLNENLIKKCNKLYTKLYEVPAKYTHELERNNYFTNKILRNKEKIDINMSLFQFDKNKYRNKKYILFFLGSSSVKKNWDIKNFIKLSRELPKDYWLYLAGGKSEIELGEYFENALKEEYKIKNLIGVTKMEEVCSLIYNSSLVIGNDSFAVHLATFLGKQSICIVGGGHFKRFLPYPSEIKIKPDIVYNKMLCFNCEWKCYYNETPYKCIKNIEVEKVSKIIKKYFSE